MVRAFIAIELPPALQASIRSYQQQLQSTLQEQPIRWVPIQNIHLTLRFLGDVGSERIKPILNVIEEAARGFSAFTFSVRSFGCFPSTQRPRVLWLGLQQSSGDLIRLQGSIEEQLVGLDFEPERRRFQPHLTLGRVKNAVRPDQLKILAKHLANVQHPDFGDASAVEVCLFKSHLTPSGAEYTKLGYTTLRDGT